MHVAIQMSGIESGEVLRRRAEDRLRLAIGSAAGQIRQVSMHLADEHRGGADKRCTIRFHVPNAAPLIIEQIETDLLVAIDRAADRAGRAVVRHLHHPPAGGGASAQGRS